MFENRKFCNFFSKNKKTQFCKKSVNEIVIFSHKNPEKKVQFLFEKSKLFDIKLQLYVPEHKFLL